MKGAWLGDDGKQVGVASMLSVVVGGDNDEVDRAGACDVHGGDNCFAFLAVGVDVVVVDASVSRVFSSLAPASSAPRSAS